VERIGGERRGAEGSGQRPSSRRSRPTFPAHADTARMPGVRLAVVAIARALRRRAGCCGPPRLAPPPRPAACRAITTTAPLRSRTGLATPGKDAGNAVQAYTQTPTMRERARRRATRNGRPRWERPLALVGARAPGPGTPKGRGAAPRVRMRSWSARRVIIRALGRERPVSMKLRCRAETCASGASSSWLSRRRVRHQRNRTPTRGARVGSMAGAVAQAPSSGDGASPVAVAARAGRGSSLRRTAA
jgi:hypothetical protein